MLPLLVFGLNHQSAELAIRERVSFAPENTVAALQALLRETESNEAAILSTCNRTELYVTAHQPAIVVQQLHHWLSKYHQLNDRLLGTVTYHYQDREALYHMMRVASGLDSMVLGEPQILGQMKSCYAVAQEALVLGAELHNVFQKVFHIAKRVRTQTAIGRNPVSVAYAAVSLSQRIFSDLTQDTALLIGAGETIDLVARHLKEQGIDRMIFANRTLTRAQELAAEFSAQAILLSDIPEVLHSADIVISSTASQLPILGKGAVESALKQRKRKPMFMVDIAVPRDIEPQVGELEDVYLYTVDDLQSVIDDNKQARETAAKEAHAILDAAVDAYVKEQQTKHSLASIKSYREHADQIRQEALQKALRDLNKGADAELVLKQMANSLVNKLLHTPTQQMKQAGEQGQHELLEISQKLLGFPDNKLNEVDIKKIDKTKL